MSDKEKLQTVSVEIENTKQYKYFIQTVKQKIETSQLKAHIKVNVELLKLYWEIAQMILEKQKVSQWGDGIIKQISKDIQKDFPSLKGFSLRNIKYMRQWYQFWEKAIGQQAVALLENSIFSIPWGHNIVIITKCKKIETALFYVGKTVENGYSRAVLVHQIESGLHLRVGGAISNFEKKLPSIQSDLAKETLKDPYCFDFLTMSETYNERELEDALIENISSFLLELGVGFAFIGRQYKVDIEGDEFRIDLLFYHTKLYCYVVVELKVVDFKPEFAGKLNFYTSIIDDTLKGEKDNSTIGIIICKSKKSTIVEYALKGTDKPLGVSEYQLTSILPKDFKHSLPQIEEIEKELQKLKGANNE